MDWDLGLSQRHHAIPTRKTNYYEEEQTPTHQKDEPTNQTTDLQSKVQ